VNGPVGQIRNAHFQEGLVYEGTRGCRLHAVVQKPKRDILLDGGPKQLIVGILENDSDRSA
jgi:hypothetical protein